ncbi:unnamed protein product [Brassica napus]|uniref:(rape) hypothetical protein n=1 Tax=Brassica napus TaxID=3708 RepID=A0A816T9Y3_BRANA|nr:unnamed protein product [Brassica napus]
MGLRNRAEPRCGCMDRPFGPMEPRLARRWVLEYRVGRGRRASVWGSRSSGRGSSQSSNRDIRGMARPVCLVRSDERTSVKLRNARGHRVQVGGGRDHRRCQDIEEEEPWLGGKALKLNPPTFAGKVDPDAYIVWEKRMDPFPGRTNYRILLYRAREVAKWIRNFGKRIGSEGWARGSQVLTRRLLAGCLSC